MTDYGAQFASLMEDELEQSITPSQPKKIITNTTKRTFSQNVDFDSYFDDLLEDFASTKVEVVEQPIHQEQITENINVQEDLIQTPEQPVMGMMDDLTSKLGSYLSRTNNKYIEPDPQDFNVVVENLHRQIQDVRRLVLENTVVSGIGQGGDGQGPGSGEVWFRKLDDVNLEGLEPGDGIIWDGEKWRPEKKCYTIDGGNYDPVYEYYLDAHSGSNLTNQNPDGATDGGNASIDPCDTTHEIRQSIGNISTQVKNSVSQLNTKIDDISSKSIRVEGSTIT